MIDVPKRIAAFPNEGQGFGAMTSQVEARLDELNDELIKKGTLSDDDIRWELVEDASWDVLGTQYHMAALRGVVLVCCQKATSDGLNDAFVLFENLTQVGFMNVHPQGAKQKRRKIAWMVDMARAIVQASQKQDPSVLPMFTEERLAKLKGSLIEQGVDVADMVAVLRELLVRDDTVMGNAPPRSLEGGGDVFSSAPLNAKDRAQLRRDIQVMAHRISSHDPDASAAYEMRGYAAWMEFQFAPEADEEGRTQMQPVPRALIESLQSTQPHLADLWRLEERLLSNPDWFEGHMMAHNYALSLGLKNAAKAILHRVQLRLKAWPDFRNLKYATGAPFLDGKIKKWIDQNGVERGGEEEENSPSEDSSQGLEEELGHLDRQLANANDQRARALIKFEMARVLRRRGLETQACLMAKELLDAMAQCTSYEWDGGVVAELKKFQEMVVV